MSESCESSYVLSGNLIIGVPWSFFISKTKNGADESKLIHQHQVLQALFKLVIPLRKFYHVLKYRVFLLSNLQLKG